MVVIRHRRHHFIIVCGVVVVVVVAIVAAEQDSFRDAVALVLKRGVVERDARRRSLATTATRSAKIAAGRIQMLHRHILPQNGRPARRLHHCWRIVVALAASPRRRAAWPGRR
jgi:hypothetical protein